ncbi:YpoC family protein [Alkalihalobacillus sp. R86527]|uniref:YpoC family protein n=1 Tax=Alkalihalobacillus sp. R86527 TaxID=3093863 RepID=UPI00366CD04B
MENKEVIPRELMHSLFFDESNWHEEFLKSSKRKPFYYELRASHTKNSNPWHSPEPFIKEYFERWNEVEGHIGKLFSSRNKEEASIEMVYQIGYFMETLFWLNEKMALAGVWQERFASIEIAPINGKERLQYVIDHYDHYTSFVQLRELVNELHKKWMRNEAMKKSQSE